MSYGVYWYLICRLLELDVFLNGMVIKDFMVLVGDVCCLVYMVVYIGSILKLDFLVVEVDYVINGKVVK